MSYPVFPTIRGLGFPYGKAPEWSSIIQPMQSGKELRLASWTMPIWHFECNFNYLKDYAPNTGGNAYTDFRMLLGSFLVNQGKYGAFLFDDPDDDSVTTDVVLNTTTGGTTADGSTKVFQCSRNFGGFQEWIQNLNGAPLIYDNGGLVSALNYSVSTTGQISFTVAPTNGHSITWTGAFYFLCRFEQDEWSDVYKTVGSVPGSSLAGSMNVWQLDKPLKVQFQSVKL